MTSNSTKISTHEIDARIKRAKVLRDRVLPAETDAYRLINSTGDSLPGLFVDIFGSVAVCQIETTAMCGQKGDVVKSLLANLNLKGVYEKSDTVRASKAGVRAIGTLWGHVPEQIRCYERGVLVYVDPRMCKTGYFLDLRDCREFLESQSENARILNCFAFTGTMGVFALRGGAEYVVHVEKRKEAMDLAKRIYKANKCDLQSSRFECQDVSAFLELDYRAGARYDIVVIDPPEYAVRPDASGEIRERYRRLNELALRLVRSRGILVTSCCSHGFMARDFEDIVRGVLSSEGVPATAVWSASPPADHPVARDDTSLDYLRIFAYRIARPNSESRSSGSAK